MQDVKIPVSTPLATSMTSHFFLKKKKKNKVRKDMDENLRDHEIDFVFISCAQVSS